MYREIHSKVEKHQPGAPEALWGQPNVQRWDSKPGASEFKVHQVAISKGKGLGKFHAETGVCTRLSVLTSLTFSPCLFILKAETGRRELWPAREGLTKMARLGDKQASCSGGWTDALVFSPRGRRKTIWLSVQKWTLSQFISSFTLHRRSLPRAPHWLRSLPVAVGSKAEILWTYVPLSRNSLPC